MAIFDLYSKRQRRSRGEVCDVYTYGPFSDPFRTQLSFMIQDLLGNENDYIRHWQPREAYTEIVRVLRKEYGQRSISKIQQREAFSELHHFLQEELDVEKCLDAIELSYALGSDMARSQSYSGRTNADAHVDECLTELNERFKEAGLGYELIDGRIVRIDSQLIHSEVIKPAIGFLNAEEFQGPRDEFLGAYEHYRHGFYEEALVESLKSFESTMKVILSLNKKPYDKSDTAAKLVGKCSKAGLIPSYNESQLQSLENVLISGIPTLRNRNGGHGQGEEIRVVEPEIVAYGLHLTASAIVMLAGLEAKRDKVGP